MDYQLDSQPSPLRRLDLLFRWVLLFYLSLILCPLRYCAPNRTVDNTWFFVLNHAAAHHMIFGRDIIWTWGPLAYLLVPFHLGTNLILGLAFQTALWIFLGYVLWDLIVAARFSIANTALFCAFMALSSINYAQDLYPGYLLPALALLLIVHFRLRGGIHRLIAALVLLGLMPLFQFVGAVFVLGVVAGFVLDRLVHRSPHVIRESALAILVPLVVSLTGSLLLFHSFHNIAEYIRSSQELATGYVFAMSLLGPPLQLAFTVLAAVLFSATLLTLLPDQKTTIFFALVLGFPLIFELRHGLVRQDITHVIQFFSFLSSAFALIMLAVPLRRRTVALASVVVLCAFVALWWRAAAAQDAARSIASLTAARTPGLVWRVLHYKSLVNSLQAEARQNAIDVGLEPDIRNAIGQQPVSFLSHVYSSALGDDLDLALLPVPQNYSAFTPYLDGRNADWLTTHGPRFLVYEAIVIDDRLGWMEAPATWTSVYRWYDTRIVGRQYLLLERRSQPRFDNFKPFESRMVFPGERIFIPQSEEPVFWNMNCSLNTKGRFRALLLEVPEVTTTVTLRSGANRVVRSIVSVSKQPVPANYLPVGLVQVAQVLADHGTPAFPPRYTLQFGGAGTASYRQPCELQFFHVTP